MDYYCPHVLGKVKYPNGYSLELAIEQQDLFMVECLYCPHVLGKRNRYSLELAIQQQDLFMVECLLHIGVSPETLVMIDGGLAGVLHLAAQYESQEIVKALLDHGADVNRESMWRRTPLDIAISNNRVENAHLFVKQGAKKSGWYEEYMVKCLHNAANAGNINRVQTLLSYGASPIYYRYCGYGSREFELSPLFKACDVGNLAIVQLFTHHTNDWKNDDRFSPLFFASTKEIFQYLHSQGAKWHAPATGLHVLHTAVSRGYVEIVQMLLDEYHIDIDLTNTKNGKHAMNYTDNTTMISILESAINQKKAIETTLLQAVVNDNVATVSTMLNEAHYTIWEYPNEYRRTAILEATLHGYTDIIKILLDVNATLSKVDNEGRTVFHLAAMGGHLKTFQFLTTYNRTNVNARDKNYMMPIHTAAKYGHDNIVGWLLTNRICTGFESDDMGKTPVHYAAIYNHSNVLFVLVNQVPHIVYAKDRYDNTAYYDSIQYGHYDFLRKLMKYSFDPRYWTNNETFFNTYQVISHMDRAVQSVNVLFENGYYPKTDGKNIIDYQALYEHVITLKTSLEIKLGKEEVRKPPQYQRFVAAEADSLLPMENAALTNIEGTEQFLIVANTRSIEYCIVLFIIWLAITFALIRRM